MQKQSSRKNRAYRRAQYDRLKSKRMREYYWGVNWRDKNDWTVAAIGVVVNTPKPHSCPLCGNCRHYFGPSLAERKSFDHMKQVLVDYYHNK